MAKPSRGRSSSRAASNGILDGLLWSSARLFRKFFHGLLCLSALVLGYRLSGEAVFFLEASSKGAFFLRRSTSNGLHVEGIDVALKFPYITEAAQGSQTEQQQHLPERKSARVHVGRHEILIRPQPHPDPLQSIKAHNLLKLVQNQQMHLYASDERKQQLLIVTPTFARTFQALHLTCLIHTLRVVPFPLTWIVIEAGGLSRETAALLSTSQLSFHHVGFPEAMPVSSEQRWQLERRLRTEGLRFIRDKQLDGIVIFVDDSNTYSFEFFKEVQKTKWIGGFSIGLLSDFTATKYAKETLIVTEEERSSLLMPTFHVQGPVCDSSGHIAGWYAPFEATGELPIPDKRALEWAGFSLNAKLLWEDFKTPVGFKSWNEVIKQNANLIESPLDFMWNSTLIEPLGDCGRSILLWRLRVEARADSKFPSRWEINPRLQIVVPSKRTPWPDHPPSRHSIVQPIIMASNPKHRTKTRRKRKVPE